ncbi:MAG TPA: hypothetical protein VKE98_16760 [Gemmataceae bacterium]|nr:hypothetical protein [Gemmataceae bacterium]
MSPTSTDPDTTQQPSLADAHALCALLADAVVDLNNLYRGRQRYPDTAELPDARWPAIAERLRCLAFCLLDAAGWPTVPGEDDEQVSLPADEWEDPDRIEGE